MFILAESRCTNYNEVSIVTNQREQNETFTETIRILVLKSYRGPQQSMLHSLETLT